jgi:hypothetical protein
MTRPEPSAQPFRAAPDFPPTTTETRGVAGGESFQTAPRVQSRRAVNLRVPHSSVFEGCGF